MKKAEKTIFSYFKFIYLILKKSEKTKKNTLKNKKIIMTTERNEDETFLYWDNKRISKRNSEKTIK